MPLEMVDRVDSLEARVAALEDSPKSSLEGFRQSLLLEMGKMLDWQTADAGSSAGGGVSLCGAGFFPVSDALDEYRMAVKKVELSIFNVVYRLGWITRTKIYF